MPDENDKPLTEEELARAREGEALIAATVADVRAPQSLREAVERDRERAAARTRAPFWRRHRWILASAGAAAAVLVVVAVTLQTDWEKSFGWRAVGRRDDTLSGRPVTTVYYRNGEGARLGYAVVSGEAIDADQPGREVTRKGKSYHVARAGRRTIVTWEQQGHTCVIEAPAAVPPTRLVDLAASRNV
jgi:hypothetical protein